MTRERRGRARTQGASEANPRRARFSTGATRRKQGKERGRPRVSKGVAGDEALRRGLSMNGERARKSARLMSGRERRAAEPPRSVSKMQSAVTNGAASRAHRILDAAISAGLAPEGNLAIAERGKGRRNRPYKCGSTVAPFVTAIYQSIKANQNSAAYTQHSYRHPPSEESIVHNPGDHESQSVT